MMKIDGVKYPIPTIKTIIPLCCIINPRYICKLCRGKICSDCNDMSESTLRVISGGDTEIYKCLIRLADHLDSKCIDEKVNNEYMTTWEGN